MPRVLRIPATVIFVLSSVVLAAITFNGHAAPVAAYHLPQARIALGSHINADVSECDFGREEGSIPCYSSVDDIVYSYDYRDRIVNQISYFTASKVNAGELINTWGTPNSYIHQGSYVAMVWRTPARSAWVYDQFFNPLSRVSFIRVGKLPDESLMVPWRGFIKRSGQ